MGESKDVGGVCTLVVFYYFFGHCYRETEIATLKNGNQLLNAAFPITLSFFHKNLRCSR